MAEKCILCDCELTNGQWYRTCEKCEILIPDSVDKITSLMKEMSDFRAVLRKHLWALEQKQMSAPKEVSKQESMERNLWLRHNDMYTEIMHYIKDYNIAEVRHSKIYPLLYRYVKIVEQIKEFYQ